MTLEYEQKNVYGTMLYYPVSKKAVVICDIMGRVTMTEKQLKRMQDAGFRIKVTVPELSFLETDNARKT